MTQNGWFQIGLYLIAIFLVTKPAGLFMTRVFSREKTLLDPIFRPIEKLIYRLTGVDEQREMRWTEYTFAMLLFSGVSMTALYLIERTQRWLPFNPQKLANLDPALAFGTAASFTTNTATGQVIGNLNMTVTSTTNSSVLTLTSNPNGLTGTSSGTLTTTGVLSNGVVVGTWTLKNSTDSACNSPAQGTNGTGFTFIMCQNASTCSPTPADRPDPVAETLLSKPKIR